ncbi:MAG TPA: hypothetical protein VKZ59_16870 [Acidobacteriota bacterium]|nr:hypothetical protein [Acidobacteriota bacterium]
MPSSLKVFEHQSLIRTTIDDMVALHSSADTSTSLVPPPAFIQVIRDHRRSLVEGEIEFNLWLGVVPVRWVARHEPGVADCFFIDRMVAGPMAEWVHHHIFRTSNEGVYLIDRIFLRHRDALPGLLTRIFFDGPVLRLTFIYRHRQIRKILESTHQGGP